ncbi:Serine incorporator 2-like protein [Drosera capensis]
MSCLMSCCAWLTCGCCSSVASGISKRSARLAYCGLFGASLIFAWILREVAAPLLEKIPSNQETMLAMDCISHQQCPRALSSLGCSPQFSQFLYSALRAGSSTTFLSPPSSPRAGAAKPLLESEDMEAGKEKKETEARPVSYSYTFFHLIFALASMYAGMLLSGWTSSSESSDLIDVGWTSVWVRICTEWVTAGLYVWSLLAPLLLPDREFS